MNKWLFFIVSISMVSSSLSYARLQQQSAFKARLQQQNQAKLQQQEQTRQLLQQQNLSQQQKPFSVTEFQQKNRINDQYGDPVGVSLSLAAAGDADKKHNHKKTISIITDLLERYPNLTYPNIASAYAYRAIALLKLEEKNLAIEDLWKLADLFQQHGEKDSYALVTNKIQALSRSSLPEPVTGESSLPKAATSLPEAATSLPEAATSLPEAAIRLPEAATSLPEPAIRLPEPATRLPEPATRLPEPATRLPEPATGESSLPDSTPLVVPSPSR